MLGGLSVTAVGSRAFAEGEGATKVAGRGDMVGPVSAGLRKATYPEYATKATSPMRQRSITTEAERGMVLATMSDEGTSERLGLGSPNYFVPTRAGYCD